jgi:hypothetical protein
LHKPDSTSANPKRDKPSARTRDHEHVGRISTQTTIFVLIAIALILYEIQWILPPFVIAGLLAYVRSLLRCSATNRQKKCWEANKCKDLSDFSSLALCPKDDETFLPAEGFLAGVRGLPYGNRHQTPSGRGR